MKNRTYEQQINDPEFQLKTMGHEKRVHGKMDFTLEIISLHGLVKCLFERVDELESQMEGNRFTKGSDL